MTSPSPKRSNNPNGRPRFKPTQEQRETVRSCIGYGLLQDQVCKLIINPQTGKPISEPSLRRHFRAEIDDGEVKANALVLESLFKNCRDGNVTAQIWWTKTRLGWHAKEPTGDDGTPLPTTVNIDAREQTLIVNGMDPIEAARRYAEFIKRTALPCPA